MASTHRPTRPPRARPVTKAWRDSIISRLDTTDNPPALTAAESFAVHLPEFSNILLDPAGYVWVIPYQVGTEAPDTVAIFTPVGARAATVVLPGGFRLGAINDTTLIAIAADSNDVESVRVLRLRR